MNIIEQPDPHKTPFDKKEVYERELTPLLNQVFEICRREDIPLITIFCCQRDTDGNCQIASSVASKSDGFMPETMGLIASILLHRGHVPMPGQQAKPGE